MAWHHDFDRAFKPKAIAVVGVSSKEGLLEDQGGPWALPTGRHTITALQQSGFRGRIYPIHPKAPEMLGLQAYPTLASVAEPIDLVIITLPAPLLPAALEECITAGAHNIHIGSAGFGEVGDERGRELDNSVLEIARRGGLRIVGPNGLGLACVPSARMSTLDGMSMETGSVALLSQSGNYCREIAYRAPRCGICFSKIISFGNGLVLDSTDFLEYLETDPDTKLIVMYLEGVKDGSKLVALVKEINRSKPVILWKAGLTEAGGTAASSHTGSLGGSEAIWNAFFNQTGAVPAYSLEELLELTMTFSCLTAPARGPRVGVMGIGGGSAVATADSCNRAGLQVPAFSPATQTKLAEFIEPAGNSSKNPLDAGMILVVLPLFEQTFKLIAADPMIDIIQFNLLADFVYGFGGVDHLRSMGQSIIELTRSHAQGKPVAVVILKDIDAPVVEAEIKRLAQELIQGNVAVYDSLPQASRALAKFARYHQFQRETQ